MNLYSYYSTKYTRTYVHLHSLTIYKRNMASIAASVVLPSLCLPRIYHKFDENYVEQVFNQMFGADTEGNSCIKQIDFVGREDRRTGEPFWLVFIHFTSAGVNNTPETSDFVDRINKGLEVNIQYCYPKTWFWKARKNKKAQSNQESDAPRPRIMPIEVQEEIDLNKTKIKQTMITNKTNWADAEEEEDSRQSAAAVENHD